MEEEEEEDEEKDNEVEVQERTDCCQLFLLGLFSSAFSLLLSSVFGDDAKFSFSNKDERSLKADLEEDEEEEE